MYARTSLLFLLTLAAAACAAHPASVDTGAPPDDSASLGNDAGATDDTFGGAPDAESDAAVDGSISPPSVGTALIGIQQDNNRAVSPPSLFSAIFAFFSLNSGGSAAQPGWTCANSSAGVCRLTTCSHDPGVDAGGVDAGGMPSPAPNGGVITITGGELPGPVTLTPDATGGYVNSQTRSLIWTGVETFMVSATGSPSGAPAFAGSVASAPDLTITSPPIARGQPLSISRSADLRFAWTANGAADPAAIVVIALSASTPTAYSSIACEPLVRDGNFAIPSALIAMLPAGQGSFSLSGQVVVTLRAGDWDVYLNTLQTASVPTGAAGGTLMVQ